MQYQAFYLKKIKLSWTFCQTYVDTALLIGTITAVIVAVTDFSIGDPLGPVVAKEEDVSALLSLAVQLVRLVITVYSLIAALLSQVARLAVLARGPALGSRGRTRHEAGAGVDRGIVADRRRVRTTFQTLHCASWKLIPFVRTSNDNYLVSGLTLIAVRFVWFVSAVIIAITNLCLLDTLTAIWTRKFGAQTRVSFCYIRD